MRGVGDAAVVHVGAALFDRPPRRTAALGEARGLERLDERQPPVDRCAGQFTTRHVGEDLAEGRVVEARDLGAEEDRGGLPRGDESSVAVHQPGEFLGEPPLGIAGRRVRASSSDTSVSRTRQRAASSSSRLIQY
jgi:hypothetical protein